MANIGASVTSKFTGLTASLLLGGHEVGTLQNVSWDEATNIIRVPAIGSPIDYAHIGGKTEYTITASRALIDGDAMITVFNSTIAYKDRGTGADYSATVDAIDTVEKLHDFITNSEDHSLTNKTTPADVIFEVMIKDLDSSVVIHFTDCRMQSKRSRVDANGIIVTEDITMFARQKSLSSATSTIITGAAKS